VPCVLCLLRLWIFRSQIEATQKQRPFIFFPQLKTKKKKIIFIWGNPRFCCGFQDWDAGLWNEASSTLYYSCVSYEEEDTCVSYDTSLVYSLLLMCLIWGGGYMCVIWHTPRLLFTTHVCHMRRRIHVCHMTHASSTLYYSSLLVLKIETRPLQRGLVILGLFYL
jgi:hypothetical protein